ncbi:MAG: hypothetical protein C0605_15885 [Hyphomicrobiales bacterium]|nr:MAG: hypothetical protein C0605_15885 [Hyphomicrobiales bacterium]
MPTFPAYHRETGADFAPNSSSNRLALQGSPSAPGGGGPAGRFSLKIPGDPAANSALEDRDGLGHVYRSKQTQLARWKAEEDLDNLLFTASKANGELLAKAGRGAPGHAANALKAFELGSRDYMRRLKPELRDHILPRLEAGREALLHRAASDEVKARQDYFLARIDDRLRRMGEGVASRPHQAPAALNAHFQIIDDADLPPSAKKALKARAEGVLRGLIQNHHQSKDA